MSAMTCFRSNIGEPKAGWMRFRFFGVGGNISLIASYTPEDSFYEFVTALQALLGREGSFDIPINEEPDEWVLRLSRIEDQFTLTLLDKTLNEHEKIAAPFSEAAGEIGRNLLQLLDAVGEGQFEKEWYPAPRDRIQAIWKLASEL